jgi:hypothetical protein
MTRAGRELRRKCRDRRRLYLAAVLPLSLALISASPAAARVAPRWHRVFADTFTRPNPAAWTRNWLGMPGQVTSPPNSYEQAAMAPGRVSFTSSDLVLTTQAQSWTAPDGAIFPDRSGTVTGFGKQGYLPPLMAVARLRLACTAAGVIMNWPSFWLVGDPYHWPQDGEIDVVEGLDGVAAWHAHYVDAAGVQGPGGVAAGDWCGWHTFRVIWHADGTLDWQYDSAWVGHVTGYTATAPEFPVIMYSMAPQGSGLDQCPPACSGPVTIGSNLSAAWLRIYQWR